MAMSSTLHPARGTSEGFTGGGLANLILQNWSTKADKAFEKLSAPCDKL